MYRPGAIGDTILTLPALDALRRRFPGCRITYAGNTAMLPLLPVEEALSADDARLLPLFGDPPRPWPDADMHIVFARQPRGLPGLQRDPLQAISRRAHMADWLANAIEPCARPRQPKLEVAPGTGTTLVVHPGAGSPAKRWPAERFAELIGALQLPCAIVRGPADPAFECAVEHEVWRDLPLPELASRLKGSRLFVGNDSGISHLAAAVGTPTVAIYVSTEPAIWGPRGVHTRRLQGDVSAAEALQHCRELLAGFGLPA
ncbi:MAG TPA: glycosyltransferase family 9 protein [Chloroflexota bacterium]